MISKNDRENLLGQFGRVILLTGLSGAGKSTIAKSIEEYLYDSGYLTFILDGDVLRTGLNSDLTLSEEDRNENIRRSVEVAKLFSDAGVICICALIAPYKKTREMFRKLISKNFTEIYVKCPIEELKRRDTKGLYKKQELGEIKGLTGIDAPYEEPDNPDIIIETNKYDIKKCTEKIVKRLKFSK